MAELDEKSMERVRLLVPQVPIQIVDGIVQREDHSLQKAINAIGIGRFHLGVGLASFLCLMADAMNIILLIVLAPVLKCEWKLTGFQTALIIGLTFAGGAVFALPWGVCMDKYGRRTCLLVSAGLTGYVGLLSCLAPNLELLLIARFVIGSTSSGFASSVTYFAEFIPTKNRGIYLSVIQLGSPLSCMLVAPLALWIVPAFGWRWLAFLCNIPLFLMMILLCLPDSPYYHVSHGQKEEAKNVVKTLADENAIIGLPGEIRLDSDQTHGRLRDLFQTKVLAITTPVLTFLFFASYLLYFGVLYLVSKDTATQQPLCEAGNATDCEDACPPFNTSGYLYLLLIAAVDVPGCLLAAVFVDVVGRRSLLIGSGFLSSTAIIVFMFCLNNWIASMIVLLVAKAVIFVGINVLTLYTPEIFPTHVRCTGAGLGYSASRLGMIGAILVTQLVFPVSGLATTAVFVLIGLLMTMTSSVLSTDPKGKPLMTNIAAQSTDEEESD